jgi:hypothetical protein
MNSYSRYFIVKEYLFKNIKKILNVFNNCIILENTDGSEKETIAFEDISSIQINEKNKKEFKIKYQNAKKQEIFVTFTCAYRLYLISDLLTQIDLYAKINIYPVETFKCFMVYNSNDFNEQQEIFDLVENNLQLKKGMKGVHIINVNIYRSILQWIQIDSKKEMKLNFYDIDVLRQINYNNVQAILILTYSKNRFILIPKSQEEIGTIIEKIIDNASVFLGYNIKYNKCQGEKQFNDNDSNLIYSALGFALLITSIALACASYTNLNASALPSASLIVLAFSASALKIAAVFSPSAIKMLDCLSPSAFKIDSRLSRSALICFSIAS